MPATPTNPDLADFLEECGWRSTTLATARGELVRWERWLTSRTPPVAPMDATHRELKAYLAERQAGGNGPATLHRVWQMIGAVYAWAARPITGDVVTTGRHRGRHRGGAGILTVNPMLRVPQPHVPSTPKVRYADGDDVVTIIQYFMGVARRTRNHTNPGEHERALRNAAMLSLLHRSGCRVGELPWIDLHHLVRDDTDKIVGCFIGGDDGRHTKSSARRLVPVTDETPQLLEKYLRRRGRAAGPLFAGRQAHTADIGGRLTSRAIQETIKRAAARCGIKLSAHDLRRGWAVASKRAGVDPSSIKKVAGWSSDVMMNRYFGPEAEVLALEDFHAAAARRTETTPRPLRIVGDNRG